MNLRVDLILEEEQRSASILSIKFLKRLALIFFPVLFIFLAGFFLMGTLRLGNKVRDLETQWRLIEPQRDAAQELVREIGKNSTLLKALDSWPETKITVHDQLAAVMRMTPETIQITQLSYDQTIGTVDRRRVRSTAMRMQGRSVGENSEDNILLLERRFRETEPFSELVRTVTMRGFADTSQGAKPTDRIFTLDCEYHPKAFLP